jgi:hypothetical protein
MSSKPVKKVWKPTNYETQIGGMTYVLRPQPISKVLEFDDLLQEVGASLNDLGSGYVVVNSETGEAVSEEFEDATSAEEFLGEQENTKELEVQTLGVKPRDLLEKVVEGPYLILKPMIPDLNEEDVRNSPMGEIEFVIGLLVEINGMKWFQAMVKNFLEPLLPTLIQNTAEALTGVFGNYTPKSETTESE